MHFTYTYIYILHEYIHTYIYMFMLVSSVSKLTSYFTLTQAKTFVKDLPAFGSVCRKFYFPVARMNLSNCYQW